MRERLPKRLPLLALVLLAPLLVAGPIMFVRNSGDRMWGPLSIAPPTLSRPALFFPATTGTPMAIGQAAGGYDLMIGEAATDRSAMTGRLTVTTAGSFPVVVGNGWNGTQYGLTALMLKTSGAAAASLPACSGTFAGTLEWDTTNSRMRLCDGSIWQFLGTSPVSSAPKQTLNTSHFYNSKTVATESATETSLTFTSSSTPRLQCTPVIVGVGAGNAVVDVRRNGATQFSLNVGCTTAVGTSVSSTGTGFTIAAGDDVGIRVNGTACSTIPELMCHLEVYEP